MIESMRPLTQIKTYLPAILAAGLLAPLGLWLIAYSWPQHHLYYRDYRFDASEAQTLSPYPRAMLAHGDQAWQNLATDQASAFYRQAVARDVLFMDAWLKLAKTEAARGHLDAARDMLSLVAAIAGHTSRWQASIALLAHELGMGDIFRQSINFLVDQNLHINDTFLLLETHCGGTPKSLATLTAAHHTTYLKWLMGWNRVSDARLVWQHLSDLQAPDESILLKYIDFLVLNKVIDEAQTLWEGHTGNSGVTNGGFEYKPSGTGFDWRAYPSQERYWKIRYAKREGLDNSGGIEFIFSGKANVNFYHFYQIVPLTPGMDYRLTYGWRGKHLNTDQGPFVDLVGYDCDGFYVKGPMLLGSTGWRTEQIEFSLPQDCKAVNLRLRREESNRFDNKFEGKLWLDDFQLEPIDIRFSDG